MNQQTQHAGNGAAVPNPVPSTLPGSPPPSPAVEPKSPVVEPTTPANSPVTDAVKPPLTAGAVNGQSQQAS